MGTPEQDLRYFGAIWDAEARLMDMVERRAETFWSDPDAIAQMLKRIAWPKHHAARFAEFAEANPECEVVRAVTVAWANEDGEPLQDSLTMNEPEDLDRLTTLIVAYPQRPAVDLIRSAFEDSLGAMLEAEIEYERENINA